jgi:hypothetical protein
VKHLRQAVLAEFRDADLGARRRWDYGTLTIVDAQHLRTPVDVLDLDEYERELALADLARRRREQREANARAGDQERRRTRHTRLEAEAYAAKLRRDAAGRRQKRLQRARTLSKCCKHCERPLSRLTPRTVHRKYCHELCKSRYWAARKKAA